jgi:hypothetical protein
MVGTCEKSDWSDKRKAYAYHQCSESTDKGWTQGELLAANYCPPKYFDGLIANFASNRDPECRC